MPSAGPLLPTTAWPFGADTLACALTLAGTATPTAAELATALAEMYPSAAGPTVSDLLAAGWLVPAASDRARLRQPPLPLAEVAARLAAAEAAALADSRNKAGIKSEFSDSLERTDSREIAGIKPEFSESSKRGESRRKAGMKSEFSEPVKKGNNRRIADAQPSAPPATTGIEPEQPPAPLFSYYRGGIAATVPHTVMTPAQLFAELTSDRHRAATEALRAAPVGSPQRAELKKRLDYVTPAGIFTRRANNGLQKSSGLLVLDFDHSPDVAAARAALLADELLALDLVLLFTSPSGDGLKVLVRTDPTAAHLDNFRAYADYLAGKYGPLGLRPDEAGKDVARACFVPYAPDAWLAPAAA